MNLYKNDEQQHVFAETCPPDYWEVRMIFEHELPIGMTDDEIDVWLSSARIVSGLWAGPMPDKVEALPEFQGF